MKMYEEYKDTGDIWLQSVPAHWKNKSIKSIMKLSDERCGNREYLELLSVYREYGVIKKSSRDDNYNKESEDTSKYKYVGKNYIVMNKMKMWQGSLGISKYEGIVSPAYIVCKPTHNFNNKFLNYLLRSNKLKHLYNIISYGVRIGQWDLRFDDIKNYNLYIPPPFEQGQIVRFLDNKLEKIDRLIAIKQRQIEILKEIVLSLFYNIRKNSKIEIPLKKFTTLEKNFIDIDYDKLYQKLGMYNRGRGIFFRDKTLGVDLGQSSFQNVISNRLIISGQFAWEGAVSITRAIPPNAVASHRYYLLRINNDLAVPEYLWAYFMSEEGKTVLNSCSHGAAGRNKPLNIRELLEVEIPLPKRDKQEIIKKKILELEKFRTITSHTIQLLQEFRTRLISDAVTGAIDVSSWKSKASD